MAENELLNLGHPSRWRRTRNAISSPGCTQAEVVASACQDLDGVIDAFRRALHKGKPLSLLLEPALGSHAQIQAVIALFKEKGVAQLLLEVRSLFRNSDVSTIASKTADRILEKIADQLDAHAGRCDQFQSYEVRKQLRKEVDQAFAAYREPLRKILESSLWDKPVQPYKRRFPSRPKMTASQVLNMSVATPSRDRTHAHRSS